MEIKEKQTVTETKEITIGYKCDVCGKESHGKYFPDDWHSFSHNHNEWGDDSVDSYEYHLVCSAECYSVKLNECVIDLEGRRDAKVDEMEIQFARKLNTLLQSKA